MKDQRYESIKIYAKKKKRFTIQELADELNVSITTIRRDVTALAKEGYLTKYYGRIVWNGDSPQDNLSSDDEMMANSRDEEIQMAHAAAELVEDGDYIFVESGAYFFPLFIKFINRKNVTAVTSDLQLAQCLLKNELLSVIVLGGYVWRGSYLLYGDITERSLGEMHFNKYFTMPGAIPDTGEVMYFDAHTGGIRNLLRKVSEQTILIVPKTRIGRSGFLNIGTLDNSDVVITNSPPNNLPPISNDKVKIIFV